MIMARGYLKAAYPVWVYPVWAYLLVAAAGLGLAAVLVAVLAPAAALAAVKEDRSQWVYWLVKSKKTV